MSQLGTESAFEVLARAKRLEQQGMEVVHLEIGEPDFATPPHIVAAAEAAIEDGYTHYTPAGGIPEVRDAVAAHYAARLRTDVTGGEVILTPGSKNILLFAMLALIEAGDEVILPDPGYPVYPSLVSFMGAKPVSMPLREDSGFRFDAEELASLVTDRTRMIILNSPENPTGGILHQADLLAVAELAVKHDLWVVSDEIYSQIAYEGECPSIASIPGMRERTIIMDGLSKAYAMCGWRLGIGVAPAELIKAMETLMINSSSCATAFIQVATMTALDAPESEVSIKRMVDEYRVRRDTVVDGLNGIPDVQCHRPGGAFYVFPNVTATGIDEHLLADALLAEAGVAVLAGTAFGKMGKGFIRLSYATDVPTIEKGVGRIRDFLSSEAAARLRQGAPVASGS
jgi:aspartate aminotransferase